MGHVLETASKQQAEMTIKDRGFRTVNNIVRIGRSKSVLYCR